jgi:hypothetical protein
MTKAPVDPSRVFFDNVAGHPVTPSELLEMMKTGCSLAEARGRSEERSRIRTAADAIEGHPFKTWPSFHVRWDLDPANFYQTYDGADPPDGGEIDLVLISDVPLSNIDTALTPYWHRTAEEVWTVGSPDKAARAIIHWKERGLMTPPLLVPTDDGRLAVAGGNHRLAVARAKGISYLPVLSKADQEAMVRQILKV